MQTESSSSLSLRTHLMTTTDKGINMEYGIFSEKYQQWQCDTSSRLFAFASPEAASAQMRMFTNLIGSVDFRLIVKPFNPDAVSIGGVSVLSLLPGDVVVMNYPQKLSKKQIDSISELLLNVLPEGVKTLITYDGATVSAIKAEA
jgi:hypothetical protein